MLKQRLSLAYDVIKNVQKLIAIFYYRKYFEWGLPTRQFTQVNIETNTICNRTCHFCLYGIKDEVPANPMPANLYFSIIDQLAEMKFAGRLSLFSTNEPLTDKRIYDFIRYAALTLPRCYHTLVTNGDLLTHERLDKLFDSGLDLLVINSYDEQALDKNRKFSDYVMKNYPGKIMHTDRTVYTGWVSRAGHIKQYAKALDQGFCDLPNFALYINPKGQVLSCCHDFEGQNCMGDLTKQSIKEAWYGQQFAALRQRLNKGDRSVSELCSKCDHEPDLAYFKLNAERARLKSRIPNPLSDTRNTTALTDAHSIKATQVEREKRSHAKRVRRKSIPIERAFENE